MTLSELDRWHKTKRGLLAFGLFELVIAYGFASWAIDSANLFGYLLTIIFTFGALQNFYKIFRK